MRTCIVLGFVSITAAVQNAFNDSNVCVLMFLVLFCAVRVSRLRYRYNFARSAIYYIVRDFGGFGRYSTRDACAAWTIAAQVIIDHSCQNKRFKTKNFNTRPPLFICLRDVTEKLDIWRPGTNTQSTLSNKYPRNRSIFKAKMLICIRFLSDMI